MSEAHVARILELFASKENEAHVAETVDQQRVIDADYNLSVSTYVEPRDTREQVDIVQLNARLRDTVAKIDRLRSDIDAIVAEIKA